MNKIYQFVVEENDPQERVDIFLERKLVALREEISRSFIQNNFNQVFVNGERKKKSYKLKIGDHVQFVFPKPEPTELIPEDIDFETVYEDENLIVVNKPAGLVVHPARGNYTGTLVHGLLNKMKFNDDEYHERPGIVHRLDKDTSGLLVVAKNIITQSRLMTLFKQRKVDKKYKALVRGKTLLTGKIDEPIERHQSNRKKFRVGLNGKPSLTYYSTEKHFEFFYGHRLRYSLVDVKIVTGRTHQIRVHFSSIGHPIVGDVIYSSQKNFLEKSGMALCAYKLSFVHPITEQEMVFEIDLPEYFQLILRDMEKMTKA